MDANLNVQADIEAIDDDTTAPQNAESFFDGNGYGPLFLATTIKGLNGGSQTNLELNGGVSAAGSYIGCRVVFFDATGSTESFTGVVTAYATNGSALQYTADGTPSFTLATNDIVEILPP